ncbi:MAG TPA: YcxB family protein [Sulfurovum sp.]|nr:YcxB family protein [Sulfurovum sp.]
MNITYQLTRNEYQQAVTFHNTKGKRAIILSFYAGITTFLLLAKTDFSNIREVITNMIVVFFAISFYILFIRMISDYQAKKLYLKSPSLSDEVTLHISGKGIKSKNEAHSNILPWSNFIKWMKNDQFYLLYTNTHQFNVIPIRAMNKKQQEELDTYLEKYIPKK